MNKDILTAALRLDEAITFGRIEPFHGTCRHLSCSDRVLPWPVYSTHGAATTYESRFKSLVWIIPFLAELRRNAMMDMLDASEAPARHGTTRVLTRPGPGRSGGSVPTVPSNKLNVRGY